MCGEAGEVPKRRRPPGRRDLYSMRAPNRLCCVMSRVSELTVSTCAVDILWNVPHIRFLQKHWKTLFFFDKIHLPGIYLVFFRHRKSMYRRYRAAVTACSSQDVTIYSNKAQYCCDWQSLRRNSIPAFPGTLTRATSHKEGHGGARQLREYPDIVCHASGRTADTYIIHVTTAILRNNRKRKLRLHKCSPPSVRCSYWNMSTHAPRWHVRSANLSQAKVAWNLDVVCTFILSPFV